jgi:hypothetical protein
VLSVVKTINSPQRTQRNAEKKTSVPLCALCGKIINSPRSPQIFSGFINTFRYFFLMTEIRDF